MERTVLVQVCSSGFVAFVSFQHITPDRLSQYLCCRGKGLGELIARSSQSPAQTTRYTSRSHTHTHSRTARHACHAVHSIWSVLAVYFHGASPQRLAKRCAILSCELLRRIGLGCRHTDKHGRTDTFNAREPCQRCPPETLANWTQPSAMQQRYKCLPARALSRTSRQSKSKEGRRAVSRWKQRHTPAPGSR